MAEGKEEGFGVKLRVSSGYFPIAEAGLAAEQLRHERKQTTERRWLLRRHPQIKPDPLPPALDWWRLERGCGPRPPGPHLGTRPIHHHGPVRSWLPRLWSGVAAAARRRNRHDFG